jgi:hypothetical protein
MSIVMIALAFLFFVFLASQFGARLQASGALLWWLFALVTMLAVINPEFLHPVAKWLQVELVSNLVFAGMILFLVLMLLEQTAQSTLLKRKFRQLVAKDAACAWKPASAQELGCRSGDSSRSRVLVVLPTFNEAENIERMASNLKNLVNTNHDFDFNFCFINDGSLDQTEAQLLRFCPNNFVSHKSNLGVSGALLTGCYLAAAQGYEYLIQCDADGQHPVHLIPSLCTFAKARGSDLVVASRFAATKDNEHDALESTTLLRRLGSIVLIMTLKLFGSKASFSDPTSGFRIYGPRAIQILQRHMPDEYPEPETLALLHLAQLRIDELPVRMNARETGQSSIQGLKTLQYMIKCISALLGLRLRALISPIS